MFQWKLPVPLLTLGRLEIVPEDLAYQRYLDSVNSTVNKVKAMLADEQDPEILYFLKIRDWSR